MKLTFHGHSCWEIQGAKHRILIDPYLSDSLTHKYAGTDRPHVRMTERVVAPERLTFIDVVTSSHNTRIISTPPRWVRSCGRIRSWN